MSINVGSARDQRRDSGLVSVISRQHHQGVAVGVGEVHRYARVDVCGQHCGVAAASPIEQA